MEEPEEVFLYSGQAPVPRHVRRVRFDSSVTKIPAELLEFCRNLVTVELNEGLKKIGEGAFYQCYSLRNINFPSTLEAIDGYAFNDCVELVTVEFNEGLKVIGERAFSECLALTNIKFPSTLEDIGSLAFVGCTTSLVSVELPEGLKGIDSGAFAGCRSLRNLFIPSTVTTLGNIFTDYGDRESRPSRFLAKQFPGDDGNDWRLLINALKTRFDGLPIHKLCYFQSHHPTATTLERLQQAVMEANNDGVLEERVDAFGMTPFHILALSVKPNTDLLQALMGHYSSKFLYKKDVGGKMAIDYLVENEVPASVDAMTKILFRAMVTDRIKCLGLERWRTAVKNETDNFPERFEGIRGFEGIYQRKRQLKLIYSTLAKYEWLEVLSLLEEFLWSMKLDEAKSTERALSGREQKKKKAKIHDDSNKQAYRINCGADIVLSNVLPYLGKYSEEDEAESSDEESEGDSSEDEEAWFGLDF